MEGDNNSDINSEELNLKDSGSGKVPQVNNAETGKKPTGNNLIRCDICCCEMSSALVLNSHINGSRHKKKMKALEIVANLKAMGEKGINLGSEINTNCYKCDICCLTVNSPQQLEIHLSGSKHKNKVAKEKSVNFANITNMKVVPAYGASLNDDETPPLKKKKKDEQTLVCDICNIGVNSETQYEQHVYSKKHLSRSKGENIVKKSTALENEPNFPTNFTSGNQYYESEESDGSCFQDEGSINQYRNGNVSNIIQVHSSDNNFHQSFKQNRSEFGNSGSSNNNKQYPRHFINNRQLGEKFGGVGLYEVGKFFSKPRSNVFNSNESVLQASPKP